MQITKMCISEHRQRYIVFDKIPELTYEKIGADYVGSATDKSGNVIFSSFLGYEGWSGAHAFAGRELTLAMKNGTEQKIKNHWYDCGSYKPHGAFIGIGASTLERLQNCYVYCSYNIGVSALEEMEKEYLQRDKLYEYDEIKRWCDLQYEWFPLIIDGIKHPFVVNRIGRVMDTETQEQKYVRHNRIKYKNGKSYKMCTFILQYNNGKRLIKIERKFADVMKETLPAELFAQLSLPHPITAGGNNKLKEAP